MYVRNVCDLSIYDLETFGISRLEENDSKTHERYTLLMIQTRGQRLPQRWLYMQSLSGATSTAVTYGYTSTVDSGFDHNSFKILQNMYGDRRRHVARCMTTLSGTISREEKT